MSTCNNCRGIFYEKYCGRCGQALSGNHRLETLALTKEVFHSTFHTGGGMGKTVLLLLINPRAVLQGYLDGRRKFYFSPIKLFLVCSVIYITTNLFVDDHDYTIVKVPLDEMIAANKYFFIFASIVISAGLNRLVFYKWRYNYAEHLVVAMYVYSFIYIFMSAAMLLLYWFDLDLIFYAMTVAMIYYTYAMTRFYNHRQLIWRILGSVLVYLLTLILFTIPILFFVIRPMIV